MVSYIEQMMAYICHLWCVTYLVWYLRQSGCHDIYSRCDGDRMCFKSDIEHVLSYTQSVCIYISYIYIYVCVCVCIYIIYIGYDVINIVGAMTYKQCYDVINRGCDVINNAYGVLREGDVISYIHRLWYHQSSGCDYTDTVSVMSYTVIVLSSIHHVRYLIYWVWCPKHRRCLVIETVAVMSQV